MINLKMTKGEQTSCKNECLCALPSFPGTVFLDTRIDFNEEPEAPTVSLGEKVIWLKDTGMEIGIVKWIGRIPLICSDWTAGVEFENPIGHGNGELNGRRYFRGKGGHVLFMPMIGLIKYEEYIDDGEEVATRPSAEGLCEQGNGDEAESLVILPSSRGRSCDDGYGDLAERKTISSFLSRSLQRPYKRKVDKRTSLSTLDQAQDNKFKNSRKTSLNSGSSYSNVDDRWPVIESDSEIDYKGGIHVLMSCFTLGTSYRRRKTSSAAEYLENKTEVLLTHTSKDCDPKIFITEQSRIQDNRAISTSLSNVSSELACCNNSRPALEKKTARNQKRRKKRKAPPPPHFPPAPINSSESTVSKTTNNIDDLPDVIGKLYVFSNTSHDNKEKERSTSSNVSVLCKGRYARVIEEKSLKEEITSEHTFTHSSSAIVKQKSVKRKSAKKRPAPQPPMKVQTIRTINTGQSEQNRTEVWYNESNLHQIDHCKLLTADGMYFENLNQNPARNTFTPACLNNLHPPFTRCNCVTCNHDRSTLFLPHIVYPVLPRDLNSSNITVLGYCNVEKTGRAVLMQNSNAFVPSNNNSVAFPAQTTMVHCSHCNVLSKSTHRKCCIDEGSSKDKKSEEQCVNTAFIRCRKSHLYGKESFDDVTQRTAKENCCCGKHYLDNKNASKKRYLSNMLQDKSTCKTTSHTSAINFCSCSDKEWLSEENSDEDEANNEKPMIRSEASLVANTSEVSEVLPRTKTKSYQHITKFKSFEDDDEFSDIQDLMKSRPSVKDFIAAFNYLTQKTNSDLDISSNDNFLTQSVHSNHGLTVEETNVENNFDLKSLPTKWRYSPVSDKKALPSKESNNDLLALKCNKNKKVTFRKDTKLESRSSVNLYNLKDTNSKHKMQQQTERSLPSISSNDIINKPLRHSVVMAHNHAYNQHLVDISNQKHISKESGCSHRRRVMHNGYSSKEVRSIAANPDKRLKRPIQNSRQLGYRKMYRAPPAPGHAVTAEKGNNSQNKVANNETPDEKYQMKGYSKEPLNDRSKSTDDKIWVSLYIEDKSSHRGLIPLLLSPAMTLRMLKIKLETQFGYPRDLQRWILGKSFATDDNATLASYNVTEAGCPVFLYMTAKNLPCDYEAVSVAKSTDQNQDTSTEESDSDITDSDSGTVILASDTEQESSESSGTKPDVQVVSGHYNLARKKNGLPVISIQRNSEDDFKLKHQEEIIASDEVYHQLGNPVKPSRLKRNLVYNSRSSKGPNNSQHKDLSNAAGTSEVMRESYKRWVEIEEKDLISNLEPFECPICFQNVPANAGIMLKDCLHLFCRECLSNAVYYAEEAVIKCPFINEEYSCDSHLQEREIKALVSTEVYERHLQRSIAAAESQAKNSFHCKTPDCPGWCLYEDKVNLFLCPVCGHLNCLTCQAIHEGRNCRQYQDELEFNSTTSDEAKKTKDYLDNMLKEGEAMRCPQCHIILMKKWGCDWLKCSVCLTEVCWVTKGRRWGTAGRGDTSGGCRCGVNGVRCHPKCNYCH